MTDHTTPRVRWRLGAATVTLAAVALLATPGISAGAPGVARPAGASGAAPAHGRTQLAGGLAADDAAATGRLLLVLDASGSMNDKDPSGLTKIAAAKAALAGLVSGLPAQSSVGLRVYGATQPGGRPTAAACADTQLVHPISTLDKVGLTTAINHFRAKGETPIAHALTESLKDLGTSGKRSIVLVSDGEESCVPDPCPVVRSLVAGGVDLQIDTVGFGVDAKARKQLQCLADAGNGTYYDAADAPALRASLGKVSTRALRSFSVSGRAVTGSTDPLDAPSLSVGAWRDVLADDAAPKYYRVGRTPGSTLHINVATRPQPAGTTADVDRIRQRLLLPDGTTECSTSTTYRFDVFTLASVVSDTIFLDGTDQPRTVGSPAPACFTADSLLLEVKRQVEKASMPPTPAELLVIEEPAATGVQGLPAAGAPAARSAAVAPTFTATVRPVTGGGTFSDAADLADGTWSDTAMVGEELFYRVRLDWGQRASVAVNVPADGSGDVADGDFTMWMSGFTADRTAYDTNDPLLSIQRSALVYRDDTKVRTIDFTTPEVRYRNRESNGGFGEQNVAATSLSGWYYIAVRTGSQSSPDRTSHAVIPIRLAVKVSGTPTGKPDYAATASTPVPSTSTTTAGSPGSGPSSNASAHPGPSTGPSRLPLVGGGLLVLAAAGGVAYALKRRQG